MTNSSLHSLSIYRDNAINRSLPNGAPVSSQSEMIQEFEKLEKSITERIRLCERIAWRDGSCAPKPLPHSPPSLMLSRSLPPSRPQQPPFQVIISPRPPPLIPSITITPPSPQFTTTPMPFATSSPSSHGPTPTLEQLLHERITRCEEIGAAMSELSNCPGLIPTMTPRNTLIALALGPPKHIGVSIGLSGGVRLG